MAIQIPDLLPEVAALMQADLRPAVRPEEALPPESWPHAITRIRGQLAAVFDYRSSMPFLLRWQVAHFLSPYLQQDKIVGGNASLLEIIRDVNIIFSYAVRRDYIVPRKILHLAIFKGNVGLVRGLLAQEVRANFPSDGCEPYLHLLLNLPNTPFQARREMLRLLLQHGADPNYHFPEGLYAETPLTMLFHNHTVSEVELIELAEILQINDADLHCHSRGRSLLHLSISRGKYRFATFLIERGADIFQRDDGGFRHYLPIHQLLRKNDLLIRQADGTYSFYYPPSPEKLRLLQLLLEKGTDPNDNAGFDVTPSHLAIVNGNSEELSLLLKYGSRPDEKQIQKIFASFPQILQSFLSNRPELLEEIRSLNRACLKSFFDSAIISPHQSVEEQFDELPPSERLKYQQPLLKKVIDLYEQNEEFTEFLNPYLKLFSSMHSSELLGENQEDLSEDCRNVSQITSCLVAQAIAHHIETHNELDFLPSLARLISQGVLPHALFASPLPEELVKRFYSLIKPQLVGTIPQRIVEKNSRELTANLA